MFVVVAVVVVAVLIYQILICFVLFFKSDSGSSLHDSVVNELN